MTKNIGFLLLIVLCFSCKNAVQRNDKPKVAFSFDDPLIKDMAHYKAEEWDRMILETLDSFDLHAILYVHSNGLNNEDGKKLLQKWNDKDNNGQHGTITHQLFMNHKPDYMQQENTKKLT